MFIVTDAISIKFEDMTPCNAIDPSWIVSGEVDEANHVIHTSSDGKFIAQIWECRTPAEVFIDGYPVDEFITVIDGEVELVCDGVSERFGAGDLLLTAPWKYAKGSRSAFSGQIKPSKLNKVIFLNPNKPSGL